MLPEVRCLFTQVEVLVRLLLVEPCSSAEAEISFSALRRLKTWLRSSMTQQRLNNVAVCQNHQKKLEQVDIREICQSFASANDKRGATFGAFVLSQLNTMLSISLSQTHTLCSLSHSQKHTHIMFSLPLPQTQTHRHTILSHVVENG